MFLTDVSTTVNMLPRLPHENGTIKVQLKRKLQYKSSALSLNVRPHKVIQAASWLASNSVLYQQEGITVNQTWSESLNDQDDITNPVPDYNSDDLAITENVDNLNDDDFSEDKAEMIFRILSIAYCHLIYRKNTLQCTNLTK